MSEVYQRFINKTIINIKFVYIIHSIWDLIFIISKILETLQINYYKI